MSYTKTAITLLLLSAITGCATPDTSSEIEHATPPTNADTVNNAETTSAITHKASRPTVLSDSDAIIENAHDNDTLENIAYFSFDTSRLSDHAVTITKQHARYLISTGKSVTLNGHTDARGTQEYNIALGERRANAIKTFLLNEGVPQSRITVVSFGEEKPVAMGAAEYAYAQNRRVEFIY